jgi:hypothetical protein
MSIVVAALPAIEAAQLPPAEWNFAVHQFQDDPSVVHKALPVLPKSSAE